MAQTADRRVDQHKRFLKKIRGYREGQAARADARQATRNPVSGRGRGFWTLRARILDAEWVTDLGGSPGFSPRY
jgi:hypothetical protein